MSRRFVRPVRRRASAAAMLSLAFAAVAAPAPEALAQEADGRPTVAVLYFNNGSFSPKADYGPLSKGMADMLITELAVNPAIRVVERDRLQAILEELELAESDRIDQASAVKVGKLLGAQYMVAGGFVVDLRERMRLDVRAFSVETSEVIFNDRVEGKAEDVLDLVVKVGAALNEGMDLPARPAEAKSDAGAGGKNQFRAMLLMSRALEAQDAGNVTQAVALLKEATEAAPTFERPKTLLASIERGTP